MHLLSPLSVGQKRRNRDSFGSQGLSRDAQTVQHKINCLLEGFEAGRSSQSLRDLLTKSSVVAINSHIAVVLGGSNDVLAIVCEGRRQRKRREPEEKKKNST